MKTKASNPITLLQDRRTLPIVEAYFEFNQLKQLYRQGWLRRGVPEVQCETVAEHTFGMALLAMALADAYFPALDLLKVLRLVLLHDLGEIYAGDIVPSDGINAQEKRWREREAVARVMAKLPQGATYLGLWQEYEDGASPEAVFVKQIDRLEMALQASVYEQRGLIDGAEFYRSAEAVMVNPELRAILDALGALKADTRPAGDSL